MTKHMTDHRKPTTGGKLRHFIELERLAGDVGSHPTSRVLAKREVVRSDSRRMQEFLRIDRGITA